jgi:Icc-related predicted phosphoesterase
MDDFILEHQPRLWINCHTHESFDYEIGKTRVVCNPRGYASTEENKGVEAGLHIGGMKNFGII